MEQIEENLSNWKPCNRTPYCPVINNIPDLAVFMFDKSLMITYVEGLMLRDLGISVRSIIGKSISGIILEDSDIVYGQEAIKGKEIIIERENNGKYYKKHITPVKDYEGNVYAGMIVLQDVTKKKQYQKELELRIEELHRSNKELEQFAYVASHDLQEPLRKIRSFGDRLSEKYKQELGEEGQSYIERMQSAAGRMQGLIDDLLNFSRLTRSLEPFEKIDLSVVVKEILADLEISIEQKNAKIIIEHLPVIEAMNGQMQQLFQNLISNALKFSKPQEVPLITIKSEIIKGKDMKGLGMNHKNNNYCKIVVQDNGIGFEEKYQDRIFIIFQRLHGRSEYEGTGMGLAICKKTVENHNGIIKAESKVNEGSTFIIILPLAQYGHEQLSLSFKN